MVGGGRVAGNGLMTRKLPKMVLLYCSRVSRCRSELCGVTVEHMILDILEHGT